MLSSAAIERILHRVCIFFGGRAVADGPMRWALAIPESPDDPDDRGLTFHLDVHHVEGQLGIDCDAPIDTYTKDQAILLSKVTRAFADGLARERRTFATFADLTAFLQEEHTIEDHSADGYLFIQDDADFPVTVSEVAVAREPWITVETPFVEEVDASWLLERNGLMTYLHFESNEDGVSLSASFPLALLTGQRLTELIDDLILFCANTEQALDDEAEDEDDEGEDDEDEGEDDEDEGEVEDQ
ncbi:MAG: hypothetical protein JNL21_19935 [Myxococcales bacterium]|nr:hypothetical protein [Myxococcales bacterium]